MEVGLITSHRIMNYGSVLQTYATVRAFEKRGYEVAVIDYIPTDNIVEKRSVKRVIFQLLRRILSSFRKRKLSSFLRHNIKLTRRYHNEKDLALHPLKPDLLVVGSDQCWNTFYHKADKIYFLQFWDKNIKRISYSTSVGVGSYTEQEKYVIKDYLSNFSAISVREKSSVAIISDLSPVAVTDIIDPTLQLTADEWSLIASKKVIKKRYLFLFLLYDEDIRATEFARRIADEKDLLLVSAKFTHRKKDHRVDKYFINVTPGDFLALIRDAEYIVTNSFHGLAFCINFNKQFSVVERLQFNSRISDLLAITGLDNRIIKGDLNFDNINKPIDYSSVNQKLLYERERASNFIDSVLK